MPDIARLHQPTSNPRMTRNLRLRLAFATLILLLIAASRILRLDDFDLDGHEHWAIFQSDGTPTEIARWTPYDWGQLSFQVLGVWRAWMGESSVSLRMLSVLAYLVGAACVYALGKWVASSFNLHSDFREIAGALSALVYAASVMSILLSLFTRGYALLLALLPAALLFGLYAVETSAQKWRQTVAAGLLTAVLLASMFYIHASGLLGAGAMLLFLLLTHLNRRDAGRVLLIALGTGLLTFPEWVAKSSLISTRAEQSITIEWGRIAETARYFVGDPALFLPWVALLGTAVLAMAVIGLSSIRTRKAKGQVANGEVANVAHIGFAKLDAAPFGWRLLLLAGWVVGGLIALRVLGPLVGLEAPRHAWWLLLPLALFTGLGLAGVMAFPLFARKTNDQAKGQSEQSHSALRRAVLPGVLSGLAGLLLCAILFTPSVLDAVDDSALPNPRLDQMLGWLADHARYDDVLAVDPSAICAPFPDEWQYALRQHFPQGVRWLNHAMGAVDDARTVWYASSNGWRTAEFEQWALGSDPRARRVPGAFFGAPECVVQGFIRPPDPIGIPYTNGLRFHGVDILEANTTDSRPRTEPLVWREGETIPVRLWWSADTAQTMEYSVALHLLDETGALIGQMDGGIAAVSLDPQAPAPGSPLNWTPGIPYVEQRTVRLPDVALRSERGIRTFALHLVVYQWWDGVRVVAPGVNNEGRLPLLEMSLRSW